MELCLLHTQKKIVAHSKKKLLHTQKKIVAHLKKKLCTLKKNIKKNIEEICSKVLTLKTASEHQKKNLHVRESNPGRLRDRQKCYQLHQHG